MASYPSSTRTTKARVQGPTAFKYGRGVKYPVQRSTTGGLALSEGGDYVEEGIRHFFDTLVGEGVRAFDVVGGVQYGSHLRRYMFESMTQMKSLADYDVRRGLALWEPRIAVTGVELIVPEGPTTAGVRTAIVSVRYTLRASGTEGSSTFELRMKAR
jgi:phage baseplate assembly protein W